MIKISEIGYIETPFNEAEKMPIQSIGAKGIKGTIHLNEEYLPALSGLEGFSHIILLYYFHKTDSFKLKVTPFLLKENKDDKIDNTIGVFATRAPVRPNHIGLSIVKLIKISNNLLFIENVDMLNGTPLLDIKPFIPEFDVYDKEYLTGWLEKTVKASKNFISDERFVKRKIN